MAKKPQQAKSRKTVTSRIADARSVRYGSGNVSPGLRKSREELTHDTRAIRFGSGNISPSLQK